MKTLYVTDLDGTFLGADSRVSARSGEIVSDLSRRGALITVATARTAATVVPLLADTFTIVPAIVMTGAALWNRDSEMYEHVSLIPSDDREVIEQVCARNGIFPFAYTLEGQGFLRVFHHGELNASEANFVEERKNLKLKMFDLSMAMPQDRHAILYYANGDRRAIELAADELKRRGDMSVSCYLDIFDNSIAHLEIFAPGVSKAAAVLALKKRLGAERVVAFGDNLNDIPMLEVADYAVAVGNAFDEVKKVADEVIGPNTDDSVAKFIMQDFNP